MQVIIENNAVLIETDNAQGADNAQKIHIADINQNGYFCPTGAFWLDGMKKQYDTLIGLADDACMLITHEDMSEHDKVCLYMAIVNYEIDFSDV